MTTARKSKAVKTERPSRSRRPMSMERRRSLEGLVFFIPFIIGFLLFFMYPLGTSVQYVFSTMPTRGVLKNMTWAGLDNFLYIFQQDIYFPGYFTDTVTQTIVRTPFIVIFSLIMAVIINKKIAFRGLFRALFFLPFLLGTGFVLNLLLGLGNDPGQVDFFRGITLPIDFQNMLGEELSGVISDILRELVIMFWRMGLQILLFLSALQGVSNSLYESSRVDGATEWEMFFKITLPMISPMILVCVVYTIVDAFTDLTNPLLSYIMEMTNEQSQYTYATAMAWIYMLFVLVLLVVVIVMFNTCFINKLDRKAKPGKKPRVQRSKLRTGGIAK